MKLRLLIIPALAATALFAQGLGDQVSVDAAQDNNGPRRPLSG
jgi:hypothetical protein